MKFIYQKNDAPPHFKRCGLNGARFLDARKFSQKNFLHRKSSGFSCARESPHSKECGFQDSRHNSKNKIVLVITLVFLLVICIFLCILYVYFFSVIEKREVYAKVILSDHYGIEINGTALAFGMVVPGGSSAKEMIIENNYDRDVNVQSYIKGDIANFLIVSKNNFVLKKNESQKIDFVIHPPENSKYGVYEGRVVIVIRKANN